MLTSILAVILVLGGLIFFHELGHFSVARAFGMGVSTFSLGFGPKLFSFRSGKTEYALSLVPLGGYVALVGENDEADIPEGFSAEESFALRPAWQRLLVVLAGPFANILLAWLVCWALAFGWGTPILQPVVGQVSAGSPAEKAGLEAGDQIISINGQSVDSWEDMATVINKSDGIPMQMEIMRPNKKTDANDAGANQGYTTVRIRIAAEKSTRKTIFGEEETAWLIGVRAAGQSITKPEGFLSGAITGIRQTWNLVALTWQSFVKLAQRVVPLDQVGGPIMIAQMVGEQAKHGLADILALTALISINLGILNLLPIPVLDGGQVLFCLLEIVFHRPINKKFQEYAMRVGLGLLIMLMLLATFNDVWRIIKQ